MEELIKRVNEQVKSLFNGLGDIAVERVEAAIRGAHKNHDDMMKAVGAALATTFAECTSGTVAATINVIKSHRARRN